MNWFKLICDGGALASAPKMATGVFVSSWVESAAGRFWAIPEPGVDKPGLYVCIFKQWEFHGSGFPPSDAKRLPWMRGHEQLNSLQLAALTRALMDQYHAVAFVVSEDAALHRQLADLFQEDLGKCGAGDVVPGLPNNRITGIQRGNGIARGKGPCSIKRMPEVHRLWDAACVATDRPPVFDDGGGVLVPAANFVTPPDGVLWTTENHAFTGLPRQQVGDLVEVCKVWLMFGRLPLGSFVVAPALAFTRHTQISAIGWRCWRSLLGRLPLIVTIVHRHYQDVAIDLGQ
jgi:hypothetical protein